MTHTSSGPWLDLDLDPCEALRERLDCPDLVGRSAALAATLRDIEAVAPHDATVLLLGEPGTGKTRLAEILHRASGRAGRFVPVDCTNLADPLFESQLFGAERGAFTGAVESEGLVHEADGGTLFLDEVGDLTPAGQAKLLGLCERRRYRRVGGVRERSADVRIVAATNRTLESGRFRADLLDRLGGFPIRVPSLAERVDDVPLLVGGVAERFAARWGAVRVPADVMARLIARRWPGNVRELTHRVEAALIRAHARRAGAIADADLGLPDVAPERPARDWRSLRATFDRYVLRDALDAHHGNVAAAMRDLGLDRAHGHALLRKHGLGRG